VCSSDLMVQSSLFLLPQWRANCDVQLLLYESDPQNPDVYEMSKITDYVVSYACKGNATTETEVQALNTLIQRYVTVINFYSYYIYCFVVSIIPSNPYLIGKIVRQLL